MNLTLAIIADMFDVLHDEIVAGDKRVYFTTSNGTALCNVAFDDIEADGSFPNEFYFQDSSDSRIIRGIVSSTGTVSKFNIYDSTPAIIVSGTVGLINSGSDIEFNEVEWQANQIVIISQLKFAFPTGS